MIGKTAVAVMSLTCAVSCTVNPDSGAERRKMSFVIMLDGVRADVLENLDLPNWKLFKTGNWAPGYATGYADNARPIPDAPPSSAANHVAIATGMTAAFTGVKRNGLTGSCDYDRYPAWLSLLKASRPSGKYLFAFCWKEDAFIRMVPGVEVRHGTDPENASRLVELLRGESCPDSTLWFVDLPDHAGHAGGEYAGFYPYGEKYRNAVRQCDVWLGEVLKAIAARKSFAAEDWMIILCADHGGIYNKHGIPGGQASTIPLAISSREMSAGELRPGAENIDIMPTVLNHHGVPVPASLPGRIWKKPLPAVSSPVSGQTGYSFAFTFRKEKGTSGSPVVFDNRIGESGLAILADDGFELVSGDKKIYLGKFDLKPEKTYFLAVSVYPSGEVYFVQGHPDGNLYWIADFVPGFNPGRPDFSGAVRQNSAVNGFIFRKRPLSMSELRKQWMK